MLTHTEHLDDLNAEKTSHLFFRCSSLGHYRQGREGRFWKESLGESLCPKISPIPVPLSLPPGLPPIPGKVVRVRVRVHMCCLKLCLYELA